MPVTSEPSVQTNMRADRFSRGESHIQEKSLTLWVHDCLRDMPGWRAAQPTHSKVQAIHLEHAWCHVWRESPSQTLHSLCLFLYILACQSQAEGVRGLEYEGGVQTARSAASPWRQQWELSLFSSSVQFFSPHFLPLANLQECSAPLKGARIQVFLAGGDKTREWDSEVGLRDKSDNGTLERVQAFINAHKWRNVI